MKDTNFTFPMPPEMRAALAEYAKKHDLSMSQVARLAMREFLAKEAEK